MISAISASFARVASTFPASFNAQPCNVRVPLGLSVGSSDSYQRKVSNVSDGSMLGIPSVRVKKRRCPFFSRNPLRSEVL
jgi:hypothetical protein